MRRKAVDGGVDRARPPAIRRIKSKLHRALIRATRSIWNFGGEPFDGKSKIGAVVSTIRVYELYDSEHDEPKEWCVMTFED